MTGFRFDRDDAGIRKTLDGGDVGEFLTDVATEAAGAIKRLAPNGFYNYRDTIRVVAAQSGPDGLEAAVGVDSPGWHLPEYGSVKTPVRAPIRRGVQETGVRFEENSR